MMILKETKHLGVSNYIADVIAFNVAHGSESPFLSKVKAEPRCGASLFVKRTAQLVFPKMRCSGRIGEFGLTCIYGKVQRSFIRWDWSTIPSILEQVLTASNPEIRRTHSGFLKMLRWSVMKGSTLCIMIERSV